MYPARKDPIIPPPLNSTTAVIPAEMGSPLPQQGRQPAHHKIQDQEIHEKRNPQQKCSDGAPIGEQIFYGHGFPAILARQPSVQIRAGKVRRNTRHDFRDFPVIRAAHLQETHGFRKNHN